MVTVTGVGYGTPYRFLRHNFEVVTSFFASVVFISVPASPSLASPSLALRSAKNTAGVFWVPFGPETPAPTSLLVLRFSRVSAVVKGREGKGG